MRDRLGASRKVAFASSVTSREPEWASARRIRHCCSVTPCLRRPGRKRRITASRVRSSAIGSDSEKGRMGSARSAMFMERLAIVVHHLIPQHADLRNLDFYDVSWHQEARRIRARSRTARRACQYDVSGLQAAERREVAYEVRDGEDHPVGRVILTEISIDARGHSERCHADLIGGYDARSDRARAVEVLALSHVELRMPQPVANRPLVGAAIAEDVGQRALRRDTAPSLADDDHDLALIIELRRFPRPDERLTRRSEGGMGAHEDAGIFGPLATVLVLLVALRVIHPDAEIPRPTACGIEQLRLAGDVVGTLAVRQIACRLEQAGTQQREDVTGPLTEPGAEVENAPRPERAAGAATSLGPEVHQPQGRSSRSPARRNTPSSRRSSSAVAGTIGRRCSLVSRIPRRRIMYFIGIGLVSKNTAWLISKSR